MIDSSRTAPRAIFSRSKSVLFLTAFALGLLSFCLTRSSRAAGPICSVPGDYSTITAAVADTGCVTINVGAGIYNEYDIVVSRDVTINGNSAAPSSVVLDAGYTTRRGFFIYAGNVITISGMTIQHGHSGGNGGAIQNHGTLRLDHSLILSNTACCGTGGGGGLYNDGSATLNSVVIRANVVPTYSVFAEAEGGGIYNDATGSMTVIAGSIDNNVSGLTGGGIENLGTLVMNGVSVHDNRVNGPDSGSLSGGGGLHNTGQALLTNVTLARNDVSSLSSQGGGIYNTATGILTLLNSFVLTNTAPNYGSGGGIYNLGNLTVTGSLLRANQTFADGGGLFIYGVAQISATTFTSNTSNFAGGGLYLLGLANINNSTFNKNQGVYGGAIDNEGSMTLNNSSVSFNTAIIDGGGIYNNSDLWLSESTLTANTSNDNGGGIFSGGSGTVHLSLTTLNANTALSGGGVFNNGVLIVSDSLFNHNLATTGDGGGINNLFKVIVNSSTFSNNLSLNANGGGIANQQTYQVAIDRSTFAGNIANLEGGGIFNNNTGAPGEASLTNTTVSANQAQIGGGISNFTGTLTVLNSTIFTNSGASGGNLARHSGIVSLKNTIVASGSPSNCLNSPTNNGHNLQYGDITCGAVIPNSNPLLGPLQQNGPWIATHALLFGSPAIDAGDNSGCPATDERGVARPYNSVCDIGAYEYSLTFNVDLPLILKSF